MRNNSYTRLVRGIWVAGLCGPLAAVGLVAVSCVRDAVKRAPTVLEEGARAILEPAEVFTQPTIPGERFVREPATEAEKRAKLPTTIGGESIEDVRKRHQKGGAN